ncbi:MAG TPA: sodium:calcium antiporter [Planctomycetaceae bacterium]|nr:sodium:calcium antiporter [Planctomycetaceae bacterium]
MLSAIIAILIGLTVLVIGGELLVRGASRLAGLAGVSPLVIGLTVVAFGTSAPELAVSLQASVAGRTDIAIGNVVGSNIFNVLLILGLSALVAPLVVSSRLIRVDVPLMIAASAAMFLLGLDGNFGRVDGVVLFLGLLGYVGWSVHESRRETAAVQQQFEREFAAPRKKTGSQILVQTALILGGLVLLTLGARQLVDGSVAIARLLGMSELLIGLTIVAAGTSLPELATSVLAAFKGERDIAVGNIVGSNIFNIMCVLGLSAAVSPGGLDVSPAALRLDITVMMAVALACLPIFFTGHLIARWEGVLFLAYYFAYMAYLILAVTNEAVSRTFGGIMLGFVVPLTAVTLAVGVVRAIRSSSRRNG